MKKFKNKNIRFQPRVNNSGSNKRISSEAEKDKEDLVRLKSNWNQEKSQN